MGIQGEEMPVLVRITQDAPSRLDKDTCRPLLPGLPPAHGAAPVPASAVLSGAMIKAGLFGMPVINIGSRQDGREYGVNVKHCPCDPDAINDALVSVEGRGEIYPCVTPYGDGFAAERIVKAMLQGMRDPRLATKLFHTGHAEFVAPWDSGSQQR